MTRVNEPGEGVDLDSKDLSFAKDEDLPYAGSVIDAALGAQRVTELEMLLTSAKADLVKADKHEVLLARELRVIHVEKGKLLRVLEYYSGNPLAFGDWVFTRASTGYSITEYALKKMTEEKL